MTDLHEVERTQQRPLSLEWRAFCRCGWTTAWVYDQRSARQTAHEHAREATDA